MPIITRFQYTLGDQIVRYIAPEHKPDALGLLILPAASVADEVKPRELLETHPILMLPARWLPKIAWEVDPLIHVRRDDEPATRGFVGGRTMRNGDTTIALRLKSHNCFEEAAGVTVLRTVMADGKGLECEHTLTFKTGEPGLRITTKAVNVSDAPITLEFLTAFSLGGITPFAEEDAPNRLHLHRARMAWSLEARFVSDSFEHLGLERSWTEFGVAVERFGSVGSMPVNGFHPFAAIEDAGAGVVWAAQLATPGSWQMEVFKRQDQAAFSGGGADIEFGHWSKTIAPGAEFTTPEALLTTVKGSLDEACERLTALLKGNLNAAAQPSAESALPVIFNEWCTSWGMPTHENIIAIADRLKGSGVRYIVIDDGWAEREGDGFQQNGDWRINRVAFPGGLKVTCDALRERGFVPGIWFEFEVVNAGSEAWEQTAHHLHRNGKPLQVGNRRFWDFRDPWVHEYLFERVISLLKDNGFGYLKVDYNDTIGRGCDGAESLGEGLREHLQGVQRFFRKLREEIPDLVIENCSSGGHRLEPSFLALTAMSSFSDCHEGFEIPVIAASLLNLIPAQQNQIWAVLHAGDSRKRLVYSLAATFLGRMCLSGEIHSLSDESLALTQDAVNLYRELTPVIAAGSFRRVAECGTAWQHLRGYQAVTCYDAASGRTFIVWHAFEAPPAQLTVLLPAAGLTHVAQNWSDEAPSACVENQTVIVYSPRPWSAGVLVLS